MKQLHWIVISLVLGVLWCAPLTYRLDIGRFDSGALTHWYATEYGAGTSFRWSEPSATVALPGVGAGTYDLIVSASSLNPQHVTISAADSTQTFAVGAGFAPLSMPVMVPLRVDDVLTIEFTAADAQKDGRRMIGIAVDDVRLLPHGWHWPPLRAWMLSVTLVWLLAGVLRLTRARPFIRCVVAGLLVVALIVVRRGDAPDPVEQCIVLCGLLLALWHAQTWRRWHAALASIAVLAVALCLMLFRDADVWMPLWQTLVLLGSVALLRLRRWWWAALRRHRYWWAVTALGVLAWASWPVALVVAGLAGLTLLPVADADTRRSSALLLAWQSMFERVGIWLRGARGYRPPPAAAEQNPRQHWHGLALLRGVVVLVVMLGHTPTLVAYANANVVNIVHWATRMAVEGFFVLSGWLIGDLIVAGLDEWRQPRTLFLFLHRRWTRTLPLHWLVLLVVVAAGWSGATVANLGSYALFLQNMITPHPPFFLVAWSLSIEEWFYLVAALILSLCAWRLPAKRALLVTLLVLLLIPAAARSWYAAVTDWSITDVIRQMVPFRLDAIAAGVALVWAWRSWPALHRSRTAFLCGGLALGAGFIAAVQYTAPAWEQVGWVRVALIPVMTIVIVSLFPWLAGISRAAVWPVERWLVAVSGVSYPLYLLHYPVRQTVLGLSGTVGVTPLIDLLVTVVYVVGSLWIAHRWHHEVERPLQRLRIRE